MQLKHLALTPCMGQKPKEPSADPPHCLYKYASWHKTAGLWVVQRCNGKSPGSHPDQLEAAKIASKAFGLSLQELFRAGPKEPGADPPQRPYKYVSVLAYAGSAVGCSAVQWQVAWQPPRSAGGRQNRVKGLRAVLGGVDAEAYGEPQERRPRAGASLVQAHLLALLCPGVGCTGAAWQA